MMEFTYVITDPEGIHARPAGMLVAKAKQFASQIEIKSGDKTGDLKKIFSVMSLGVKNGQEVTLTFNGEDEAKASAEIRQFMEENL
ncbi:phosphocarrier protein HPr [Lachnospiraceae bacterium PF1-21]|uniref:HPr family phosphocarrier protein n=1 Tax=Ohessyouella blattaphilus TaxID=2949333 RepID=A0ABT1ENG6_9FIRM|nr:HPr family phosphocarrier protein [Ohessyouella blattaphilus]MCP1111327.1 HPr family phosphocarrier protein [Ohessyouella blattaphilus]MCR8564721.1 HPr family phosphocarrier protein [Ohessyouella blattaphilus]